tara:strand:+ start:669 stop:965 length:297 start_codon:yes stop_codon:yes gene_type:complete
MAKKLRKKQTGGTLQHRMLPVVEVTEDRKMPNILPEVTVTANKTKETLSMKELRKKQKIARKNLRNKKKIKKLQKKIEERSTYKTGGFLEPAIKRIFE